MSSKKDDGNDVLHNGEQELEDDEQLAMESEIVALDVQDIGEIAEAHQDNDHDVIPDLDTEDTTLESRQVDPSEEASTHEVEDEIGQKPSQVQTEEPENNDETSSIPDDTPSAQGSLPSSPRSETPSVISLPRRESTPNIHRPFERRFHSRLSSSPLITGRSSTPEFLKTHSRSSSFASLGPNVGSEPDDSNPPWEIIRWTRMKKITSQAFSEIGKRNFGVPTALTVADQIVIGTSKGMILVFDHQQNSKAMIGPGTKAVESGPITSLAISADHTTIAAGHTSGSIFTWEISKPAKPFIQISPIEASQPQTRRSDGHIIGASVVHVGFLGYRHTALVSADDRGMAFSHLATRGMGAVNRVVRTTRILGRYPEVLTRNAKPLKKSSVLAFSPLPLGNVEQQTDSLGLVAMLTPYLLVIVSTTPIAQTQHKAARPKDVTAHSAMTASLAWFPAIKLKGKDVETSNTKLVYAWSNVMTVLEVHQIHSEDETEKEKPPELQFLPRSRFKAEEAIVAVQWMSRSVLAILTITQQLIILEDISMTITDSFDLLQKNVYHTDLYSQQLQAIIENLDEEDASMHGVVADAFHMSFRAYKGRLFILGFDDIWWGSLTNWADRLLALMDIGDSIGALRLATKYYAGEGEKLTIGLPEDDLARGSLVEEKLLGMMSASLKYAFGKNQSASNQQEQEFQMRELAETCITACLITSNYDFLFDEVFNWYDEHELGVIFVEVLEPAIISGKITSLPPPALKILIEHFAVTHTPSTLEEIICLLDTSNMDIDQVTTLCKNHNLYDAYIYVWNTALLDFTSPLEELLQLADEPRRVNGHIDMRNQKLYSNTEKIFPYLSFVLTGRIYPTGTPMEENVANTAKPQIYDFFFSGNTTPKRKTPKDYQARPYSNLCSILSFDTPSFISALNEAFEDSFLNSNDEDGFNGAGPQTNYKGQHSIYNRQFIVRIMLEVMSENFSNEDTIYLDMFISRNLPKYPQYMLLSGTTLEEVFTRLCKYPDPSMREDAQLSAEYLLSVYHPTNMLTLVPLLESARFWRVLKSIFRQERQYVELLNLFFIDQEDQDGVFGALRETLHPDSTIPTRQRSELLDVVKNHALEIAEINVEQAAITIDEIAEELHGIFLDALQEEPYSQYHYLDALYRTDESQPRNKQYTAQMLAQYLRLMCQYNPQNVPDFVHTIKEGDLRLDEVLPALETSKIIDAAIILQARQGEVKKAMSRLSKHFQFLKAVLRGLQSDAIVGSDSKPVDEAIEDTLDSVDKYARVGIWLCQGQSQASQKSKAIAKSPKRTAVMAETLTFEESLWLELIAAIVAIARDWSELPVEDPARITHPVHEKVAVSLRGVIQQIFTALLTATTSNRGSSTGANDLTFLRILRAFLSHAAEVSPSLSELRNVLSSIFSAYAYEESILSLSNAMLDKDIFVHLDEVTRNRQQGWRPRGQICEVCRRRVWGPGIGHQIWDAWQLKEDARIRRRLHLGEYNAFGDESLLPGKGKAANQATQGSVEGQEIGSSTTSSQKNLGPIVVFSCRHLYHQQCLNTHMTEDEREQQNMSKLDVVNLTCPACV